ncbi:MAG: hypothetical protein KA257_06225 [Opitutaceae bacterium]|nr:hypothetical protein [Opitutaceae bacterium]MBP9912543.1 hypothetical protein [Opitutaceae bacterium]
MKTKSLRALALLQALAFMLADPMRLSASESTANPDSTLAEVRGDAAKAALHELDVEIDRVDAMLDNAPTQADRAAAKARLEVLKERRSELRKTYVRARYDELRADIRAEANRLGVWAKRTFTSDPSAKATDEMKDSVRDAQDAARTADNQAYVEANTAGAATDIAVYKLRPTDTNKTEAQAGLKALDGNIDVLEVRVDNMAVGDDRVAAKERLQALKQRRDELHHDFNKARFDALIDDVKHAWDDLVK